MNNGFKFLVMTLISFSVGFAQAEDVVREPASPASSKTLDDVISDLYTKVGGKFDSVKGRVAVMDFPSLDGQMTGLSAYISNKVGNKLIEANRQVVDRATLDKIFSEQKMQQSALMDTSTAAKIGKLAGASIFVMGGYTQMPSKISFSLRVLSVETGQFIAASEVSAPYTGDIKDEAEYLMKKSAPQVPSFSGSTTSDSGASKKSTASAFDNWMCENIRAGLSLNTIFKKALEDEYGIEEVKECTFVQYTDASGENMYGLKFDRWYLKVNGPCEDAASAAIKGKTYSSSKVSMWAYIGTTELAGQDNCLPHGTEMLTESRLQKKKSK